MAHIVFSSRTFRTFYRPLASISIFILLTVHVISSSRAFYRSSVSISIFTLLIDYIQLFVRSHRPRSASKRILALLIGHTQFFVRSHRHIPLSKAFFTLLMVRIALSNYTFSAFYCSSVSIRIFYAYYRLYLISECSHSPTSASKKHFNASYKPRSILLYLISAASNALNTPP